MISNLAFVHPKAQLGKDVIVEPFAYISGDVDYWRWNVGWSECNNNGWCQDRQKMQDISFGSSFRNTTGSQIQG